MHRSFASLRMTKVWRSGERWPVLLIAFTGLLSAQTAPQGPMGPPAKIRDIAAQAGLTASHISSPEKYYAIESALFHCCRAFASSFQVTSTNPCSLRNCRNSALFIVSKSR